MSARRRLRDAVVTRLQSLPRRRPGARASVHAHTLTSTAGYRIAARVFGDKGPVVVLVPGTDDSGRVFEGWSQPVHVQEITRRGWRALAWDPSGRGDSWGPEDYGGPEHQDDLRCVLALARSLDERVVVCSISLGLAMSAGALADRDLGVLALVDWEGPCDREIITAGGTILVPALGHSLDDDTYWHPREATRHVGRLRCGYWRLQSDRDHAQPGELRHAHRMMDAAAAGSLPWFRLNEHPRGQVPSAPAWGQAGRLGANRMVLAALDELLS